MRHSISSTTRLLGVFAALLAAVVSLFGPSAASAAVGYAPHADIATGGAVRGAALGDLNGDGHLDEVNPDLFGDDVQVRLGDGSGSFGAAATFAVGFFPGWVAIGDLNGDGHADLAVINGASQDISVLLGDGTGSFGSQAKIGVGASPSSIAIDDLNGDGHPDLVALNEGSGSVSVLLGTGTGSFGAANDFPVGASPWSIAIDDLNGDGHPDLAIANRTLGEVSVLLGDGTGSFGTPASFPVGSEPNGVAIADLSSDGHPDLVVANAGSSTVSVLLGDGTGSFAPAASFGTGYAPLAVAIADLDGDGRKDLAVAGLSDVSVLLGDGTGSFGPRASFSIVSQGQSTAAAHSISVGDLNEDGSPDLMTANEGRQSLSLLLSLPRPTLSGSASTDSGSGLIKDKVTLSGGQSPTGIVTFKLYGPDDASCHGAVLGQSQATVAGNGDYEATPVVPHGPGTYRWVASYSGDANNAAAGGACNEAGQSTDSGRGAFLVKDIGPGAVSSFPGGLANVNGTLYFAATGGINGIELWRSDGTVLGTTLVKDIAAPAGASSSPQKLTNINGTLYFTANDATNGFELWKSDGTAAGTTMVKDISGDSGSSTPAELTAVGGTLYFTAADSSGRELWKSDGTAAGTVLVKNIISGFGSATPEELTDVNGTLFFTADDGVNGRELWKSDGTAAGTTMVKNIWAGSSTSFPRELTNVGGILYLQANDSGHGSELWRSDGTEAGTQMVKDILPTLGSLPSGLVNFGGVLYFSAEDGSNGKELWKSDGTAAGTTLVKDIAPGNTSSTPVELTVAGGTLYFRASDGSSGEELWKSDGTETGTTRVKDIVSGGGSPEPRELRNAGGTLYFRANDGINGSELWRSDGTEAGTFLVRDIKGGSGSATPEELTDVNGTLFFRAADSAHGNELWKAGLGKTTPGFSTHAAAGVTLGASIGDSGTLSGGLAPSGSIVFKAYGPEDTSCAGPPAFTSSSVAVSGNDTYPSAEFTPTAAGTYRWVAEYSGDVNNEALSGACNDANESVVVAKKSQTITFPQPAAHTVGDADLDPGATASSGLAVTYSSQSESVCTIGSGKIHIVGSGTCAVTAGQPGDSEYKAATNVQRFFAVNKKSQTITFTAPSGVKFGDADFTPGATASSGLAVTYSSQSTSVCTIVLSKIHVVSAGTCVVTAEQLGNFEYNPAPNAQRSFTIVKADQTITFTSTPPANPKVGSTNYTVTTTATSSLPVSFSVDLSTTNNACTVSGSTVSFIHAGSCVIAADQPGNADYTPATTAKQTITVAKADQTISFTVPSGVTFGDPDIDPGASASSGLPVTYYQLTSVCSIVSNQVHLNSAGTCTVNSYQAGNADYNTAEVPISFTVAKADQTITFNAPSGVTYGDPDSDLTASSDSSLPVTIASETPGVCTVVSGPKLHVEAAGECKLTASQAGNGNYNAASPVEQHFQIAKKSQTITFNAPSDRGVGAPDFDPGATTTSPLAIAYSSQSASVCTIVSGEVHIAGAGECKVTAEQAGNGNYNAATPVQRHFQVATAHPTLSTHAADAALGSPIRDTALVSGRQLPLAGATLDFKLYGPGDETCSETPVFEDLAVDYPVAGGQVPSANFTPTAVGTYRWVVSYSGDANNVGAAGACNDANESSTVTVPTYAAPSEDPVGEEPSSVTVADLNGDGIPDIVTSNEGSDDVTVLFGKEGGGFEAPVTLPVGSEPSSVTVADVNGDGIPDIVTSNEGSDDVTVLLGKEGGGFEPPITLPVGSEPSSVTVADVNGDGIPDIVTSNAGSDDITILPGDGHGGFGAPVTIPVGSEPSSVTIADVNGDGIPDIVTSNEGSDDVTVLLSDGHGGFGSPITIPVGSEPSSVAVGDLNGDGVPDIVTSNAGSDDVTILLSDGHGGFQAPITIPVGTNPTSVTLTDLDGDGHLDIVTANEGSDDLSVIHGDGEGGFSAPTQIPVGSNPKAVAIGDLNGDGHPDLVAANLSDSVSAVFAKGRVTLSSAASPDITVGSSVSDKATLAHGVSPTGTIAFKLYGPDDTGCTGTPAFTDTATVHGNGSYQSASFTPTQPGTYRWVASYSGDQDNEPVAGACNGAGESVVVSPAEQRIAPVAKPKPHCPKVHVSAAYYKPRRSHGASQGGPAGSGETPVPGVRARLKVSAPAELEVHALVRFKVDGKTRTVALEPRTLHDARVRNIHLPFPASLANELPVGTKVTLVLSVSIKSRTAACAHTTKARFELHNPVVKVLPGAQHRAK